MCILYKVLSSTLEVHDIKPGNIEMSITSSSPNAIVLPIARARLIALASLRWFLALTPTNAHHVNIHIIEKHVMIYQFDPEARFFPCLKRKARAI